MLRQGRNRCNEKIGGKARRKFGPNENAIVPASQYIFHQVASPVADVNKVGPAKTAANQPSAVYDH